jgi:glycosyltransferase involved in cell wall biosynthesis
MTILCPGLGIATRGFERAARDTFDVLRNHPDLDLHLIKGRGDRGDREFVAPTISRESRVAKAVARRRGRPDFWLEQLIFSATVQPRLRRLRPELVMLGEWTLTRALCRWRRATRQGFRILLYNGAGVEPPYPEGTDHVQQLTPDLYERAVSLGVPAERQTMLPHALRISSRFRPPGDSERAALRKQLDLPVDGPLLLSVGAINKWHKRMDYLIEEVASIAERPHLVLLGAREEETPAVLEMARSMLGERGFTARTVVEHEMAGYYRAVDAFALASGYEGFGLALVEGLGHGLPVIAQDSPRTRFILGEEGLLGDFTRPRALAELVESLAPSDSVQARGEARHRRAYENFSWQVLGPRYVEMMAAAGRAPL